MSLVIYKQRGEYYLFQQVMLDEANTDELFLQLSKGKDIRMIQSHAESVGRSQALAIPGLSPRIRLLESVCKLTGEDPPEWGVINLVVNTENTNLQDLLAQVHINTYHKEPKHGNHTK